MVRMAGFVGLLAAGACTLTTNPLEPSEALEVSLSIETPVIRSGDRLEAEVVVTNRGPFEIELLGVGWCPYNLRVIDRDGRGLGGGRTCLASGGDPYPSRLFPGETSRLLQYWFAEGVAPGQYRVVGWLYARNPADLHIPGERLSTDTLAVTIEPATP